MVDEYREYDAEGVLLVSRPFTPEEKARNDALVELENLRAAVKLVITDVRDERQLLDSEFIDPATSANYTNAQIKDNPAKFIKALKRAEMRSMAALIDLAKLVSG